MKSEGTQITCDFWGREGERGGREGGRGDEEDPGYLSDRDFGPRVCPCGPDAAQNPYACVS